MELCRRLRDELYTITPGNLSKITRKLLRARRPGLGLRTLDEMGALSVKHLVFRNVQGARHDSNPLGRLCLDSAREQAPVGAVS